jgi:hypothetical protein
MGCFILAHIFITWMSIISIGPLSEQEKELEILALRQQLAILKRKCGKPVKPNWIEKMPPNDPVPYSPQIPLTHKLMPVSPCFPYLNLS